MPTLFCLVILFLVWFTYERKKNDTDYSKSQAFWKREREAVYVPRQSTDDIKYIELPEDILPQILETDSEELRAAIKALKRLSKNKICDLSEYTNTDLRLKYGSGNFNDLAAADNNYTKLIQLSGKLLKYLTEAGRTEDAVKYLDFCSRNKVNSKLIDSFAGELTSSEHLCEQSSSDSPSDASAD